MLRSAPSPPTAAYKQSVGKEGGSCTGNKILRGTKCCALKNTFEAAKPCLCGERRHSPGRWGSVDFGPPPQFLGRDVPKPASQGNLASVPGECGWCSPQRCQFLSRGGNVVVILLVGRHCWALGRCNMFLAPSTGKACNAPAYKGPLLVSSALGSTFFPPN